MEWGVICVLIFLIILYGGVTAAIVIAFVKSSVKLDSGILVFIILLVIMVSFIISCVTYHIIRSCNAAMMSVHPQPLPNHITTPPPKPIPLHSKPGTLIQQPDGHLQIAIYEYPTIQNQDPPQCAPTSSVPTTKQADLETCTTSATTSTN